MLLASTRFASRTRTAPPPLASLTVYREDGGSNKTACAISPLSSGRPTSPTRRTQRPSSGAAGTGASVGAATGAKRGTDTSLVCATVAHESVLKSTATHGEPGAVIARCSAWGKRMTALCVVLSHVMEESQCTEPAGHESPMLRTAPGSHRALHPIRCNCKTAVFTPSFAFQDLY